MYDFNVLKVENCVHELSSSLLERAKSELDTSSDIDEREYIFVYKCVYKWLIDSLAISLLIKGGVNSNPSPEHENAN